MAKSKKNCKRKVQNTSVQTKNTEPDLGPLLVEARAIRREATERRSLYNHISVRKDLSGEYEEQGYEIEKELKTKFRLRKPKPRFDMLEDKFWMLLFRLGYKELNEGRNFKVKVRRPRADDLAKQVDVFAKDDETVIVAECKSSERLSRKSLQKDLDSFDSLKGPISRAINAHYGAKKKLKIIWFFVTENIVWSEPDKQRAKGINIRVITERELPYFAQIAEHLGSAARFQFIAEYLKDQEIPALKGKKVPAIKGKLGGEAFYCFVTTPVDLLKVAFINHRSLQDPDGAPTYQRLVSRHRMTQIGKYITGGGYFPTNLLVNFKREPKFEPSPKADQSGNIVFGQLHLPSRYRSVWVIDGQHRLYGYAKLDEKHLQQNVMVVAFANMSKDDEAKLFVTINHEQKSVPKNLLDDLEGELKWKSDVPSERIGAIAARLIGILNIDIGEPFYNRVTRQGITATDHTCLTMPAFKDGLRRSELLGKASIKNKVYSPGPFTGKDDQDTMDRARVAINSYFTLIRDSNVSLWNKGRPGYLCTNVGIQAYLYLLRDLIKYMEANKGFDAITLSPQEIIEEIEEYLEPIQDYLAEATIASMEQAFKVPFGSGGPREYHFRLCAILKKDISDFSVEGMSEWEEEQSEERIQDADLKLKELNIEIQSYIFGVFKSEYGVEKNAYWERGVTDKSIKARAYEKSLDDDAEERLSLENYLDFIEYKKIVSNSSHWHLFENVFSIPEPDEDRKKRGKKLQWMDRINKLRRTPAHATEERTYKVDDFEYIDYIYNEFLCRLAQAQAQED